MADDENSARGGDLGGDSRQDMTALSNTTEGDDNLPPGKSGRPRQDSQHPNQLSRSRSTSRQGGMLGRSSRRQERAETPCTTRERWSSLFGRRNAANISADTDTAGEAQAGGGQHSARGNDSERGQASAAQGNCSPLLETPTRSRQHSNQWSRSRSVTGWIRSITPRRQQVSGASLDRQEHAETPGRIQRFMRSRRTQRTLSMRQVDVQGDDGSAGADRYSTPRGSHDSSVGEENSAEGYHPPPLESTPRSSRRLFFQDETQRPGRSRSAPVGPRRRDDSQEAEAQRRSRWENAVAAVELRTSRENDEADEVHWPDRKEPADVCTLEPLTSRMRVTLFLQTGQRAQEHANLLKANFFPQSVVMPCRGQRASPEGESLRLLPSGTNRSVRRSDGSSPYSTIGPIATVEDCLGSHLYNEVVAITSLSRRSRQTLENTYAVNDPGSVCLVYHDKVVKHIATMSGKMTLTRRTGFDNNLVEDEPMVDTLATIFEIKAADAPSCPLDDETKRDAPPPPSDDPRPPGTHQKTVARCVVAYKDASRWSSVGPSIRSFMVRRDYGGIGLAQQLFNEVEKWFVKNWVMDTNEGNRVLKATQLKDYVVDRDDRMETMPPALVTDKMFFYDVMNFRSLLPPIPLNRLGFLRLGVYVPEAHAIKIYPPTGKAVQLPTANFSMPFRIGWRSCDFCKKPEERPGLNLVCGRCSVPGYWRAHYCSRSCQLQDWPTHKLWCGKTRKQVLSASPYHSNLQQSVRQ